MSFFGWVLVNGVLKFNGTASATFFRTGDGTAAAPAYSFLSDPQFGFYRVSANNLSFAVGGIRSINLGATSLWIVKDTATLEMGVADDLVIARDAANTLALKNGTNAQAYRVYNTFTSATDYERLEIGAAVGGQVANTYGIIPTVGSSGTLRNLIIGSSLGITVLNSSRTNVIGKLDFTVAASTFAQTATITNGPRAANPVNWVEVSYNGGTTGRIPIW